MLWVTVLYNFLKNSWHHTVATKTLEWNIIFMSLVANNFNFLLYVAFFKSISQTTTNTMCARICHNSISTILVVYNILLCLLIVWIFIINVGTARTPFPATKNYTHELFTLGIIAEVNSAEVQWPSLTPEEPPSWSRLTSTPGKYAFRCSASGFPWLSS